MTLKVVGGTAVTACCNIKCTQILEEKFHLNNKRAKNSSVLDFYSFEQNSSE
jgi:hypothetical protein